MHYLKTEDEELQCIAIGHDLLEDTDVTIASLREAGISERVIVDIQTFRHRTLFIGLHEERKNG